MRIRLVYLRTFYLGQWCTTCQLALVGTKLPNASALESSLSDIKELEKDSEQKYTFTQEEEHEFRYVHVYYPAISSKLI